MRDAAGGWRDEVLLATNTEATTACAIAEYCRRWSIKVVVFESEPSLGLHDPGCVPKSVEGAHPMCGFVRARTMLWYATAGTGMPYVQRDRPWYTQKVPPAFADMHGALRLAHWNA